ncbi:hypothetical protein NXU96_22435 [Phocaeicola vulgatus]|nr:hypothetical protein [Phocaeicola vulgatus]
MERIQAMKCLVTVWKKQWIIWHNCWMKLLLELPWTVETPASESDAGLGAAALAMKCRILQFAASPLFNSDQPYYPGATGNPAIWYGGYNRNYGIAVWKRVNNSLMELASKRWIQFTAGERYSSRRLSFGISCRLC